MMHKEQPKRACSWCDRVFRPLSKSGLYCTLGCRESARRDRLGAESSAWMAREISCDECGKAFVPHHHAIKICSDDCRRTRKNTKNLSSYHATRRAAKPKTRECEICKAVFVAESHALRALTCSPQCSYLLSRKRTAEAAALARQADPEITRELDKLYRDRSRGAPGGRLTPRAKACKICGQAIDVARHTTVCSLDCAGQARGYRLGGRHVD